MTIRVLLNGAAGKMGRSMVGFILADPGLTLVAAVDVEQVGCDAGALAAGADCGVIVESGLAAAIGRAAPDVMLDFTEPDAVRQGVLTALSLSVACVVGTTGLGDADLEEIDALARAQGVGAIVSPNFALSAVLLARFAAEAVRYFPDYELIETHHDKKKDAPSGTALAVTRMMNAYRAPHPQGRPDSFEVIAGSRGGDCEGARIHSLRLPGALARHEIIFGGPGQLLTIRQECTDRRCFWPGVRLALGRVRDITGLVHGLDRLL